MFQYMEIEIETIEIFKYLKYGD